jgi:uncharacterized protein YggL (DUF469 family)
VSANWGRARLLGRTGAQEQQLGFRIQFTCQPELSSAELERLDEQWFAEALEANDLSFGGKRPDDKEWTGFVTYRDGRSADESTRIAVERWLTRTAGVFEYRIGPLEDADSLR